MFYEDGIMALGWGILGDLKKYPDKETINKTLINEYGGGIKINDSLANFEFANSMNIGDIVIAKKSINELLGYGTITSDYFFFFF